MPVDFQNFDLDRITHGTNLYREAKIRNAKTASFLESTWIIL